METKPRILYLQKILLERTDEENPLSTTQLINILNGELISLNNSDGKFELQGKNIPSKLFCGIANWIGHLISDVSGSSSSKGRGMGIPSPIWAWS